MRFNLPHTPSLFGMSHTVLSWTVILVRRSEWSYKDKGEHATVPLELLDCVKHARMIRDVQHVGAAVLTDSN